jgi:hypothetical protein
MNIFDQDTLDVASGIIARQFNCKGEMGAGLAKKLRERYPVVYSHYRAKTWALGDVQLVRVSGSLRVANVAGQDNYRHRPGVRCTSYSVLRRGVAVVHAETLKLGVEGYIPYLIGCGLGGGSGA